MSKVSYYAGFFDGEGSLGLYKNGKAVWHLRTQVTQNKSANSQALFDELIATYGGNLSEMKSTVRRGNVAFNWQLNGGSAMSFLADVTPHLRMKREQAEFAMAWYSIAQRPSRHANGRVRQYERDRPIDVGAATLLRALKRSDIDAVMAAQADLVDVAHTLRQVVCVKG